MTIPWDQINYWAVLVAGVVAMLIGMVWYGMVFGKLWARLNGYSDEKLKEMQAARPPAIFIGGMLGSYLILALIFGILAAALRVQGPLDGIFLGALLWVGMAVTIGFTAHLASDKRIGVYVLDVSYQLVFLIAVGAIIGVWR